MSIGETGFFLAADGRGRLLAPYNPQPRGQSAFCRRAAAFKVAGTGGKIMTSAYAFRGKAVFVAGGTSGINLGIADAFAAAGASLAIVSRSADRVERASGELRRHGGKV